MATNPMVSAEVVLKSPEKGDPADFADRVAQELQALGVEVLDVGRRSISIRTSPAHFEQVFSCTLRSDADKTTSGLSYGRMGGPALVPVSPPKVPAGLEPFVASIEVQVPPLLF